MVDDEVMEVGSAPTTLLSYEREEGDVEMLEEEESDEAADEEDEENENLDDIEGDTAVR
jgi:hypothetical protein